MAPPVVMYVSGSCKRRLPIVKSLRVNEQIRVSPVRLIDDENRQLGIVPTNEALRMARDAGMDLVEVSPTEKPPVCRIMDYGKHKYNQKKKLKQNVSHAVTLKEIRIRPKTDEHDRQIKINHAQDFLAKGHKVQFTMLFRGRERFLKDYAHERFNEILAALGETVKIIRPPLAEGRRMTMVLAPATLAKKLAPAGKGGEPQGTEAAGAQTRTAGSHGPESRAPVTPGMGALGTAARSADGRTADGRSGDGAVPRENPPARETTLPREKPVTAVSTVPSLNS